MTYSNTPKDLASRYMDRMFRRVDDAVWDMMSGRVGIQTEDGIMTVDLSDQDDPKVVINMFDQGSMPIPAFAQNTAVASLELGDLIFNADKIVGWVAQLDTQEGKPPKIQVITPRGIVTRYNPPKIEMLGSFDSGVLVLRNMANMFGGSLDNIQPLLMMQLLGGNSQQDSGGFMQMMLMQQMMKPAGGTSTGANAQTGGFMQMMLMQQMMQSINSPLTRSATPAFNQGAIGSPSFFDQRLSGKTGKSVR